jgi:uncharacterized membrane protein YebE (DUF533 family)
VLDAEDVLDGLIRGALSGRRKRGLRTRHAIGAGSLVNAQTLLAAAGVAWGLFETWQQQQAVGASPGPTAVAAAPPPLPGGQPSAGASETAEGGSLPPSLLQLARLMISAARADGAIGPAERERILREAREVGAEAEVERELAVLRPVAEIVAGATDPAFKEQLYTLAFTIVRADETVTGGERIYLAQLAHCLALDGTAVARLEGETAARIEAAAAGTQGGPARDPRSAD